MKVVTTDYILLELTCVIHPFMAKCITLYISLCHYFYNNQSFKLVNMLNDYLFLLLQQSIIQASKYVE